MSKAQAKKRGTARAKKARKANGGRKAGAAKPPPPVDDSSAFRSATPLPRSPMPRDATDDASPNEGFGS